LWSKDTVITLLSRLFDKDSISKGVYDTEEKLNM
jgi:predicted transcriptional regulator